MKIIEVRDGFIKFEADDSIQLSSFIKVTGELKNYIAQVLQLKMSGENKIGYAKILFLYDGNLQTYDKTLPAEDSEITEFTSEILNNSIAFEEPIVIGRTLGEELITIDASAFDNKMLMSIDDKKMNNIIVRNLVKQFNNIDKNVVIIDTLGVVEARKAVAGVDFKLPLDTTSLAFMYQDCLNDATAESKSMIIEIFKDLSEYSKTVPFLPFQILKTIVDNMVDKEHIFKLLVLKNKLAKFDRLGYFAKNKDEVDSLKAILNSKCVIIDISKLDNAFQNRYLSFIYDVLDEKTQVLFELSNTVSKKNIKDILTSQKVATTFITHSGFKYLNDIKNVFDNFIVSPSLANNRVFDIYSTLLKSMPDNTYLISGDTTNYIPIVSKSELIDDTVKKDETELEKISVSDGLTSQTIEDGNILANIEEKSEETINKISEDINVPERIDMFGADTEDEEPEEQSAQDEQEVQLQEEDLEDVNEEEPAEEEVVRLNNSFETEVHHNIEIQDYVPEEPIEETPQEISLEESLEEPIEEYTTEEETSKMVVEEPELIEESEDTAIELGDDIDLDLEEQEENAEIVEELPEANNEIEEVNNELEVLPVSEDTEDYELDNIVELNPEDASDNDIVIDMDDNLSEEDLDEQIVKDVDKVFTTRKDDDISDSDLDFIDELNNDDDELLEEVTDNSDILEPTEDDVILEEPQEELKLEDEDDKILETRNASTPIVPVYEADIPQEDLVMSDSIQQGDSVTHAKYGNGVVEKMIKYGNKTLFSINFDNIGRRLLDPTLTEIKKA